MFGDNTARNDKLHRPIIGRIRLVHVQCAPECSKQLPLQKYIANLGSLWHRIDAKISPKAASEKAQTTVSENRSED